MRMRPLAFCGIAAGLLGVLASIHASHAIDPAPPPPPPPPAPQLSIVRAPAFNPAHPLRGRVVLIDENNAVVRSWVSPQPNDLFGLSAIQLPDVNGDGIADVAIAAPNAFDDVAGARVGTVLIASGADGSSITTISGIPDERFGLALFAAPGANPGDSPVVTVLVQNVDTTVSPPAKSYTFQSYDAFTGALIAEAVHAPVGFTRQAAEASLATYIRAAGPADLDASGIVTLEDFTILANNFGSTVDPITGQLLQNDPTLAAAPTGDTNGDGVVDSQDLGVVAGSMGQNFSPTFEPGGDVLTEAEAAAVEEGFAQAVPMEVVCRHCNTCPPIKCLRMVDWGNPLDGDPPEFDDGDYGAGPPDEDDDPGGSGGPNDPDPDGDDDGDGIRNGDDCGSAAFAGDVATDVRCQDDDGDDINNHDETDCEDNPNAEECQCNCSAEITVESVERFDIPASVGDLNYLPPHHRLVLKVSAGECDAGNKHTASWEIDAPSSMQIFEMESGQGHILEFQSDSGEGQVTITATIECGENSWEDTVTFTVKDYDVVSFRLKSWIPVDAVGYPDVPLLFRAFGGDSALYPPVPLRSNYRVWQYGIVDLNPMVSSGLLAPLDRAFGMTTEYHAADVHRDFRVASAWGYTQNPGATYFNHATAPITLTSNTMTVYNEQFSNNGTNYWGRDIGCIVDGTNPLVLTAPPVNVEVSLKVFQEYSLNTGPGDIWIRAIADYDLFPSHAVWVNDDLIVYHDVLFSLVNDPGSLFGIPRGHHADPTPPGSFRTLPARIPRP